MIKNANIILAIAFILTLVSPSFAEQKIRNMSLSVEETNKQIAAPPSINNNNNFDQSLDDMAGFENDKNIGFDSNMQRQINDINARYDSMDNIDITGGAQGDITQPTTGLPFPHRGQNQQGFINKFCGSGYTPKKTSTASQQDCMDTQRQQACERFSHATVNVQKTLSQAIDCESNSAYSTQSDCDGMDASRLDLLKQYWQDEDISYTILFLPDMVLNSAANCVTSSKRGKIK